MKDRLTETQRITVFNVQTAAGFPSVPADISPELKKPVEMLRCGINLTDKQIVEMVETEVKQNSIP